MALSSRSPACEISARNSATNIAQPVWPAMKPIAIAQTSPPSEPDQVLPGEIAGASRGPPKIRPVA